MKFKGCDEVSPTVGASEDTDRTVCVMISFTKQPVKCHWNLQATHNISADMQSSIALFL